MKKLLLILLFTMTSQLQAAQPNNLELLEEIPPPPRVEDGQALEGAGAKNESVDEEPQVTIRKKGKDTVEEYRINGELYMMKVTPSGGGVPYYLHKEDQDGGWVNIGPNPPLAIPKWILFRF